MSCVCVCNNNCNCRRPRNCQWSRIAICRSILCWSNSTTAHAPRTRWRTPKGCACSRWPFPISPWPSTPTRESSTPTVAESTLRTSWWTRSGDSPEWPIPLTVPQPSALLVAEECTTPSCISSAPRRTNGWWTPTSRTTPPSSSSGLMPKRLWATPWIFTANSAASVPSSSSLPRDQQSSLPTNPRRERTRMHSINPTTTATSSHRIRNLFVSIWSNNFLWARAWKRFE